MKITFTLKDYEIMHQIYLDELATLKDNNDNRRNMKNNFVNFLSHLGSPIVKKVEVATNTQTSMGMKRSNDKFIEDVFDLIKKEKEDECDLNIESLISGLGNSNNKIFRQLNVNFKGKVNLYQLIEENILNPKKEINIRNKLVSYYLIGIAYNNVNINSKEVKNVLLHLVEKIKKMKEGGKTDSLSNILNWMIKTPNMYSMDDKKSLFVDIVNCNDEFIHVLRENHKAIYEHFKNEKFDDQMINSILENKSEVHSMDFQAKKYVVSISQLAYENKVKKGPFLDNFKSLQTFIKSQVETLPGYNSVDIKVNVSTASHATFVVCSDNIDNIFYSVFEKMISVITQKSIQKETITDMSKLWEQVSLYEKLQTNAPESDKVKRNKI